MTSSRLVLEFVVVAAAAGAACGAKGAPANRDSALGDAGSLEAPRKPDSAGNAGRMVRLPRMSASFAALMDSIQADMRRTSVTDAHSTGRTLPRYRRMVSSMLAQMTTEMHTMNVPADVAWTATMDSLQQDLMQLPEMTRSELRQAMPAHRARVSRLMAMYREMTKAAK